MSAASNRIIALVALVVILGAGIASGVALDRIWLRPQAASPSSARVPRTAAEREDRLVKRFETDLVLDENQTRVVRQALHKMFAALAQIRERTRPMLARTRQEARAQISQVLNASQRKKYEAMIERYEQRRRVRRGEVRH
jgi:hypothetical protein